MVTSQDRESREITTTNLMRSLITPALHSATEARSVAKQSSKNLSDNDLDRVTQEHFYSGAANALSYVEKMPAGHTFGSSTIVTLPNGATLDTRSFGQNTNFHTKITSLDQWNPTFHHCLGCMMLSVQATRM